MAPTKEILFVDACQIDLLSQDSSRNVDFGLCVYVFKAVQVFLMSIFALVICHLEIQGLHLLKWWY